MKFTIKIFLLLLPIQIVIGQVKDIGLPEIRNFKRTEYKGETQNWGVDQDKNGNVYFANNSGLFQFDGASWHKFTIPNSASIRSLKTGNSGRIFVGGYNEFGYFKPGINGKLTYSSLSKLVKKRDSKIIDFIWKIHVYKDIVVFQTFEKAYLYKKNSIYVLEAPKKFQFSFVTNGKLYFQDVSKGLMEFRNGSLFPLPNTDILNTTEVWGMFALTGNKILITTIDKGIFVYENNEISVWNTEANDFIKKNNCLGSETMPDNH